jgi:hypothetical protein
MNEVHITFVLQPFIKISMNIPNNKQYINAQILHSKDGYMYTRFKAMVKQM